jgi:muconolactone delta-isomerase
MNSFMMVCTFKPGTVMDEVSAVAADEQAKVRSLQDASRMGAVRLSLARGTVFLEVFAEDSNAAETTVHELPMAKWWDLESYPLAGPPA